jgi:hypothetical protein
MADGFVHIVHEGGDWVNENEGGAEFGGSHSTKEQAVAAGRRDHRAELVRERSGIPPRLSKGRDG